MEMRNLILAISISLCIMLGWQYFYEMPRLEKLEAARQSQAATQATKVNIPAIVPEVKTLSRADAIGNHQNRINIASPYLHGSLSLLGARFDDLTLANYHETIEKDSPEVVLLSPSTTEQLYFAETGWLATDQTIVPGADTLWQTHDTRLSPQSPITLQWKSPENVTFYLKIAMDEQYLFTIEQSVENNSGRVIQIAPFARVNRARKPSKSVYILHEGPISVLNGILYTKTYSNMEEEPKQAFTISEGGNRGWFGITDKYWLTAFIPQSDIAGEAHFLFNKINEQHRFQADWLGKAKDIPSGERLTYQSHMFAGAKKIELLDHYAKTHNIALFDKAIDFGWFYFLTKPILLALKFLFSFLGNFGLAILAFTVFLKLLLFPLANKSYRSMNAMKKLQPELQRIRERFKDDKMRQQQEMMAFYKKEKINPAAGCLPILIQIPIFFALYKVLYVTIEMRHAPFYGWIHDLSAPDPTSVFNLFGLLPYGLPQALTIGVWPLVLGLTMFIQQRINPPPADPVQAQVMKVLPVMFTVLFAHFPAGLVIYYCWNNTLSILQQRFITRDDPERKAAREQKKQTRRSKRAK